MTTEIIVPPEVADVALDAAGFTDIGREREKNEDQFLVATVQRSLAIRNTSLSHEALAWLPGSAKGTILVVADGMGGAGGGDIASAVAVRAIANYLTNVLPLADAAARSSRRRALRDQTLPGVRQGLEAAIARGDSEVRRAARAPGAASQMGTTLTMAYILWPHLYVAHVGDSRCYLLRNRELQRLTTDHTLAEKLRERTEVVIDDSSPWHHVLWNALGGDKNTEVEPEVHRVVLETDDVVMLCSDGLTKHVMDQEIAPVLERAGTAIEACKRLVALANDDGGTDNVTVVVARSVAVSHSEAAPTLRQR